VQFLDNFKDVHPYSSFEIAIQPLLKPPYFEEKLVAKNITQCITQDETLWSYILPKVIDPNNQTVSIFVTLDKTFFTFDHKWRIVKQVIIPSKDVKSTL
jgi:hypothetical protein